MSSRTIRGPLEFGTITEKTSSGDVTVANESVININKASGAATGVTLPAPVAISTNAKRRMIFVKDVKGDAATNNITVSVASSGTINGSSTYVISENYGAQLFEDTGSEWQSILPPGVSATEIAFLNGVTAGTGAASKALVLDSNGVVTLPAAGMIDERNAEIVTTTNVIAATENGRTYYLNNATGFVSTLPAPAIGLHFTFINMTANTSGNHTVVTTSSANIIKGNQNSVAGDAGDSGTGDDTINFVANNSLAGDKVEVFSDGTSWFAYAISRVAAGVTFTTAS